VRIVAHVDALFDRQILADDMSTVITYGNANLASHISTIMNDMTG